MTTQNLKVYYTNIQSLASHFDLLTAALTDLNRKIDIDVIALSETWISEEQLKLYNIAGYRSFIQPRKDGRRSGGVVMYLKNHLKIIETECLSSVTGNFLKMKIKQHDVVITLILLYRDCSSSKTTFVNELERIIDLEDHNVILLGDMNINIFDKKESSDYLNVLRSSGYSSKQNSPTRDRNCLDHVMVKSSSKNIQQQITVQIQFLDISITDHSAFLLTIEYNTVDLKSLAPRKFKVRYK